MPTTVVSVPSILEPRAVAEDFVALVTKLNETAMEGKEYLLATKTDGLPIALPVHGLVIEVESEDA